MITKTTHRREEKEILKCVCYFDRSIQTSQENKTKVGFCRPKVGLLQAFRSSFHPYMHQFDSIVWLFQTYFSILIYFVLLAFWSKVVESQDSTMKDATRRSRRKAQRYESVKNPINICSLSHRRYPALWLVCACNPSPSGRSRICPSQGTSASGLSPMEPREKGSSYPQ